MHSHINKAKSFNRCLKYVFGKPGAQFIAKNNLIGESEKEWTSEMNYVASVSERLKKPVLHLHFSPHPNSELCDNSKKATEFIKKYLREMGWSKCQWVLGKHFDTETPDGQERPHYHLVLNRIELGKRKSINTSWCAKRSQEVLRQLRKEYGLQSVRKPEGIRRKPNTVGQERRYRKEEQEYLTGDRPSPPELSVRQQLQELIDRKTQNCPTLKSMQSRLEEAGVETRITPTDKGPGISYKYKGVAFRGISLGRGYTISGLKRYGQLKTEAQGYSSNSNRNGKSGNPDNPDTDNNGNPDNNTAFTASKLALTILHNTYNTHNPKGSYKVKSGKYTIKWNQPKQKISVEKSSDGEILRTGVDLQDSQVLFDIQNSHRLQQRDVEQLQKIMKLQRQQPNRQLQHDQLEL